MYVSSHLDTDSPACPSPWNTTDKTRHIVSSVIPSKTHTLAIYNRTYSHLLLELRGEKACDDWWWMRERERSHRPCHASCYLSPIDPRSRLALFEEFVLAVVLVDTLYCYVKTRNMCVYIYICMYVTSEIRAQSRTRGMHPARRKRADRGRNSDAKDNVEEFTFRSWYIVSNKIESRFCQILPPRVRCFFFSFLFLRKTITRDNSIPTCVNCC